MNKKIIFVLILITISIGLLFFFLREKEVTPEIPVGGVLNIYNWEDYLSEEVVSEFERKYGIKVNVDFFEDSDDVLIALRENPEKYDLVIADDDYVEYFVKLRLFGELNQEMIPNIANIDRDAIRGSFDEEINYCVPYVSGYTGIAFNSEFIEDYDGSRDIFWNEDFKGKITMVNNAAEILLHAIFYLGYNPQDITEEQLREAEEKAIELKKMDILFGDPVQQREWIVSGDAWIGYIYSTEVVFIYEEKEDIEFLAPKEGAHLWSDSFCISKDSKNKEAAHLFLNYLLEKEVMAKNSEDIYALMPGKEIKQYIDKDILGEIEELNLPENKDALRKSTYVNYILLEEAESILSNITRELKIRE
jgi:spermidine/putrescine transport system substrate-binding protein